MDSRFLLLTLSQWLGVIATCLIAGTSGRLAYKPIGFVYTRREVLYAAGLSVWLLVIAFGVYNLGADRSPAWPLSPELNRLIVAIIALLPVVVITLLRKQPAKSLGWNPVTRGAGIRLGIMLAFLVLFLSGKVWTLISSVGSRQLYQLLLWLLIVLAEETIFRGFIQLRLVWAYKTPVGILLTALIFTLSQLPWLLGAPGSVAIHVLLTAGQSLLLSWVMLKGGHVLAPALYRAVAAWLVLLP